MIYTIYSSFFKTYSIFWDLFITSHGLYLCSQYTNSF